MQQMLLLKLENLKNIASTDGHNNSFRQQG